MNSDKADWDNPEIQLLEIGPRILSLLLNVSQACMASAVFTFKQRAHLPPASYASLGGVLAQSGLQQKQWDSTCKQKEHIRDEEHPWGTRQIKD